MRNKKPHGNTAALRRTGRHPAAEHVNTALSPLYIHAGVDSKEGGEGNLCSAWLYWFLYVTDYMGKGWTGGGVVRIQHGRPLIRTHTTTHSATAHTVNMICWNECLQ